jgi:hypothetical protein
MVSTRVHIDEPQREIGYMVLIPQSSHTPTPTPSGQNQQGAAKAFWGLVAIGVVLWIFGISWLFTALTIVWSTLTNVLRVPASAIDLGSIWGNLMVGGIIGVILGIHRFRLRSRSRFVEELVSASADATSVARVGVACVVFYTMASLVTSLAVGFLGVSLTGHVGAFVTSHSVLDLAAFASRGGGPPPPLSWLALASALAVLVVLVGVIAGLLTASGFAFLLHGAVSGAVSGTGRLFGFGMILVITRLSRWVSYPPLARDREAILYAGWFKESLRTGAVTGAVTGIVFSGWIVVGNTLFGVPLAH